MVVPDAWFEILLRTEPSTIFNCIPLCKTCLEVITSPEFRQAYQEKWKLNSKVVGFTAHDCAVNVSLKETTELSRNMNTNLRDLKLLNTTLSGPRTCVMSKSGTGDLLFGSVLHLNDLYVLSSGAEVPVKLPKLPCNNSAPAILSRHDSYKVVLIVTEPEYIYSGRYRYYYHTFSPAGPDSYSDWITDYQFNEFHLSIGRRPGIASSSRGLVYWPMDGDYVAVYDDNVEKNRMSVFDGPPQPPNVVDNVDYKQRQRYNYGLSPQGGLQCAIQTFSSGFPAGNVHIWVRDDVWKQLYNLDSARMPEGFAFVSFFPGRSDRVFVRTRCPEDGDRCELSLYNLDSDELEEFSCSYDQTEPALDLCHPCNCTGPQIFQGLKIFCFLRYKFVCSKR